MLNIDRRDWERLAARDICYKGFQGGFDRSERRVFVTGVGLCRIAVGN